MVHFINNPIELPTIDNPAMDNPMIGYDKLGGPDHIITNATWTVGKVLVAWGMDATRPDGTIDPIEAILDGRTADVIRCFWTSDSVLTLEIDPILSNSGFTTKKLNGIPFDRTDAVYSTTSGRDTWIWSSVSNPFVQTVGAKTPLIWIF